MCIRDRLYSDNKGKPSAAQLSDEATANPTPKVVQGVYTLATVDGTLRPTFVPVTTGITGATDIEVLSGVNAGDEIVTGRYQILRNLKSGIQVKRDNSPVVTTDTDTSS